MENYIIIKTDDGVLKFCGNLLNCDMEINHEDIVAYGGMKDIPLLNLSRTKSVKITAELDIGDAVDDGLHIAEIKDIFEELKQLREVNAQLRQALEEQEVEL